MDVQTYETCWGVNGEIIKRVTSSWSIFIQLCFIFFSLDTCSRTFRPGCWKLCRGSGRFVLILPRCLELSTKPNFKYTHCRFIWNKIISQTLGQKWLLAMQDRANDAWHRKSCTVCAHVNHVVFKCNAASPVCLNFRRLMSIIVDVPHR